MDLGIDLEGFCGAKKQSNGLGQSLIDILSRRLIYLDFFSSRGNGIEADEAIEACRSTGHHARVAVRQKSTVASRFSVLFLRTDQWVLDFVLAQIPIMKVVDLECAADDGIEYAK